MKFSHVQILVKSYVSFGMPVESVNNFFPAAFLEESIDRLDDFFSVLAESAIL